MHNKLLASGVAVAIALAVSLPAWGAGTASAHPGHRSCAGGMNALIGVDNDFPVGPGQGIGGEMPDFAHEADGRGVSDEIASLFHADHCAPAP